MPCNSDHMEATPAETYTRHTAQHILYVASVLGRDFHPWIEEAAESYYGNIARSDELTSILCKVLGDLPDDEREALIFNGKVKEARRLADWWERHQRIDTEKSEEQKQQRLRKNYITNECAKLFPCRKDQLKVKFISSRGETKWLTIGNQTAHEMIEAMKREEL